MIFYHVYEKIISIFIYYYFSYFMKKTISLFVLSVSALFLSVFFMSASQASHTTATYSNSSYYQPYNYNNNYNSGGYYNYNTQSCPTLSTSEAPAGCYYQIEMDTNGCQKRQLMCYPTTSQNVVSNPTYTAPTYNYTSPTYYSNTSTYPYTNYNTPNYNYNQYSCPSINYNTAPNGCLYVYGTDSNNCKTQRLDCSYQNRITNSGSYNYGDNGNYNSSYYNNSYYNGSSYYKSKKKNNYNSNSNSSNGPADPTVQITGNTRYGNTFTVNIRSYGTNNTFEHRIPSGISLQSVHQGNCSTSISSGDTILRCNGETRVSYSARITSNSIRNLFLTTNITSTLDGIKKSFVDTTDIYSY